MKISTNNLGPELEIWIEGERFSNADPFYISEKEGIVHFQGQHPQHWEKGIFQLIDPELDEGEQDVTELIIDFAEDWREMKI